MTDRPDTTPKAVELIIKKLNGHRQASIEKGFRASALFAKDSIEFIRAQADRIAELEAAQDIEKAYKAGYSLGKKWHEDVLNLQDGLNSYLTLPTPPETPTRKVKQ